MPSRNRTKVYVDDGYYHIYNRGVDKMTIFKDKLDYSLFLSSLKTYLLPKDIEGLGKIISNSKSSTKEKNKALKELGRNNFHNKIELISYCLMPNHFHFLIKTKGGRDIEIFMKSLMTRFTKYFNKRYDRVGPLFQGRYKAVLMETDEQMLYLTRYIHRNPIDSSKHKKQPLLDSVSRYPSSYPVYLRKFKQSWVKPEIILHNFAQSGPNSYKAFVEDENYEYGSKTTYLFPYLFTQV